MLLLGGVAVCLAVVATLPASLLAVAVLFVGMGLLGMGNGAVFQLVPQRFPGRMGIVTGVVGAAGGLGGFFLPSILGAVKDATGAYGAGLMSGPRRSWPARPCCSSSAPAGRRDGKNARSEQSGIFSYRGADIRDDSRHG